MLPYPRNNRDMRYGMESLERFNNAFSYSVKDFGMLTQTRSSAHHDLVIDHYCFLYILTGSLNLTFEGNSYYYSSSSLILLEPFKHYHIELLQSNSISFYHLSFDLEPAHNQGAFLAMIFEKEGIPILPTAVSDFGSHFGSLVHLKNGNHEAQHAELLKRIIMELFSATSMEREFPSLRLNSERELAIKAIEFIKERIHEPLKVSDVSAYLEVSDSYLYKAFLHIVAVPPGRFILHKKAKCAAYMLCVERYSIGEVAQMLGYSSLFHFSKSFKSIYGLSPRAYTKTILRRDYLV